jgi:hypothetical protein
LTGSVDPLKKQSWGDKRYYVVLSNMDGTEHRVSDTTYEWREAVALAEKFHGLTKEQAWARFASLPDVRSVLPHDS